MPCTNLNQQLVEESGRIMPEILRNNLNTSPWLNLINTGPWTHGMGDIHSIMTYERALPDTYPTWTNITANDGTDGSGTCSPSAEDIEFGKTLKQFTLQQTALKSQKFCLKDLINPLIMKQQLQNMIDILGQNTAFFWIERHRDEYVRLCDHKVIANSALTEATAAFPNVAPTSRLTQSMLNKLYNRLDRDGGSRNPLDRVQGQSVFGLVCSSETSEALIKLNADIRQDYRYSTRANELLAPLGIDRVYRNFFHIIDQFPPRWDFIGGVWYRRLPYENQATTYGNSKEVSALYQAAEYEDSMILHQDVYTSLVPRIPNVPDGMEFGPQRWGGEFKWRNIPDETCNVDEDIGFWRAVFVSSSMPKYTRFGYTIRHKRCPWDIETLGCEDSS